MKWNIFWVVSSVFVINLWSIDEVLQVNISRTQTSTAAHCVKTNVLLVIDGKTEQLEHMLAELTKDLETSGQCLVTTRQGVLPQHKQDIEQLYGEGYPFVLFLQVTDSGEAVEGRLYDAFDVVMLQGKKWHKRKSLTQWSHKIAQDVWQELMGNKGSFLSYIAFVKKERHAARRWRSRVCVTDWRGADLREITGGTRMIIAPAWNLQGDEQRLFFSEFTNRNVRLMATDMSGNIWPVIDADGTHVGVAAVGANEMIFGKSGELWRYVFDVSHKRGHYSLVVRDDGTCACPSALPGGDILYCAGGRIKIWRVSNGMAEIVACQGYCAAPAFHIPSRRIVYSKRIGGNMQLFVYAMGSSSERQLTFDKGDKLDPSWSPCGNFVAYCRDRGSASEIMVFNIVNSLSYRVSPEGEYCSSPSWSPLYD